MSRSRNIQSMIGYGLPYVFVEKIKLTDSVFRREDRSYFFDNHPSYVRDKYGQNKKQSKTSLDNKEFVDGLTYKAEISLVIPELLISSRWHNKDTTVNMTVRVVQSTHPLATKNLRRKSQYIEEELPEALKPFVSEQVISIPKNISLSDYRAKEIESMSDVLCLVPLEVSFKANSSHLTYFLYSEAGGKVGYKTIESVIDGGQTKKDATCYYLPSGEVWSGPVHYHSSGGWMAGPVHTSRRHPSLERMIHNNVKIQDYRIFRELQEIQNTINLSISRTPVKLFTQLFLSRDAEGGARGLFAFDMKKALVHESRFNSLFLANNKNNLLKRSKIEDLKIVRQKVELKNANDYDYVDQSDAHDIVARSEDQSVGSSLLRSDYFVDENMDGTIEKYIGSVSEKSLAGLGDLRGISFYDSQVKEFESGQYRYGVEITMTDPTEEHLQLQVRRLRKAHHVLSEYYNTISNKQYYNPRGQIDYQGVKFLGSVYGSSGRVEGTNSFSRFPWRRAVKMYLSALREMTDVDITLYSRKLYPILGPTSRTTEGVEAFLKLLEALIQKLSSYDSRQAQTYSDARSSASHNRSPDSGLITMTYFFDNTYDANSVGGHGLDYFGDYTSYNYTGPLAVSASSLRERFAVEASRKGVGMPAARDVQAFRELYSTLAPISIKTAAKDYPLEDEETAKEARLRLLQSRREANSKGAGVPDQGTSTYDALRSLLRQGGSSATIQTMRVVEEDPCDPEVVTSERGDTKLDTTTFVPGGKNDNFNSKETLKPSGRDEQTDDLEEKVPLEILESLVGQDDQTSVFDEESVGVKYVTGFNSDLDVEYVDGPFSSDLPYLVIIEADNDETQGDILNEIVIVGDIDSEEPKQEEPLQDNPPATEPPEEQPEVQEGGDDESIMDLPDNAEAVPETAFNTGAEQLAPQTEEGEISRDPVVDSPPTIVRTEQEQTYLVGVPTEGGMAPRGGRGGY